MQSAPDAWTAAIATLRAIYRDRSGYRDALESNILPSSEIDPRGTGYVVDSLFSAKRALEAGAYEAVVKAAVAFAHDTDTTACIAGGIAGIRDGLDAIPAR